MANASTRTIMGAVGPGGTAGVALGPTGDTSFYRHGVGVLQTQNLLLSGHLGVGNYENGGGRGTPAGRFAIYDSNDTLLGYVPVVRS
jgi:hypothetical protein